MSGTMKSRASVAIAVIGSALVFVSIGGAAPPGTHTQAAEAAACAALYGVPAAAAPDPLASCQWDMRAIGATPSGSYAVNQGRGARVGDIDTGIDLTNTRHHAERRSRRPRACSSTPTTPTADPSEQVTRGDCSNKAALQDLAGHGTHTGGHDRRADQRHRRPRASRPKATIVVLKAGHGSRATSSPSRSSTPSGTRATSGSTSVNMSFFADPWLFNCRNDKEQKAIIQAISDAARYAEQRGVVLVAAAGNDGIDLNHPTTDEISPDYPPGAAVTPAGQQQLRRPADRDARVWSSSRRRARRTCWRGTRPTGTSPT